MRDLEEMLEAHFFLTPEASNKCTNSEISSSVTFTVRARAIFAAAILFLVLFCCFRCGIVYQILFTAYVQRKRMNILWFDFGDEFVGLSS